MPSIVCWISSCVRHACVFLRAAVERSVMYGCMSILALVTLSKMDNVAILRGLKEVVLEFCVLCYVHCWSYPCVRLLVMSRVSLEALYKKGPSSASACKRVGAVEVRVT